MLLCPRVQVVVFGVFGTSSASDKCAFFRPRLPACVLLLYIVHVGTSSLLIIKVGVSSGLHTHVRCFVVDGAF